MNMLKLTYRKISTYFFCNNAENVKIDEKFFGPFHSKFFDEETIAQNVVTEITNTNFHNSYIHVHIHSTFMSDTILPDCHPVSVRNNKKQTLWLYAESFNIYCHTTNIHN